MNGMNDRGAMVHVSSWDTDDDIIMRANESNHLRA
jgi:hypothetical protein